MPHRYGPFGFKLQHGCGFLVLLHSVNEGVSAAAVHVHASPGVLDVALALGALMIPLLLRQLQESEVLRSPLVFWQSLELCALHVRVGRLAVPAQPNVAVRTTKLSLAGAGVGVQVDDGRTVSCGARNLILNTSIVNINMQEFQNDLPVHLVGNCLLFPCVYITGCILFGQQLV